MAATRKIGLRPTDAQRRVAELLQTFETFPHSQDAMLLASQEAALGRFQFWDAVLLASASQAGCEVCLSEDMQDGARLENIVVRNPFGRNGISVAARTVPRIGLRNFQDRLAEAPWPVSANSSDWRASPNGKTRPATGASLPASMTLRSWHSRA